MALIKELRILPLFISIFAIFPSLSIAQSVPYSVKMDLSGSGKSLNYNGFKSCISSAAQSAIMRGASSDVAYAAIDNINVPDERVIDAYKSQPETKLKIWDYMAEIVDEERVSDGKKAYNSSRDFLNSLSQKYGIDAATIVAIWGVETNYGKITGKYNVISALGTMGCTNIRRKSYFKKELISAIKIASDGRIPLNDFKGSWAGAFGQTQFMPSSYERIAIDGNNNGTINIITEYQDALASTANFLKRVGWQENQNWGYEVNVPPDYKGISGRLATKTIMDWQDLGFIKADNTPLPMSEDKYGLIFPSGRGGPAFLVGRNFNAVYGYNPAIAYALAVNVLADRIKGGNGIIKPWNTDDPGISRAQKREIQQILQNNHYETGNIDGLIGPITRKALMNYFNDNHIVYNGRVGKRTYETMKKIETGK